MDKSAVCKCSAPSTDYRKTCDKKQNLLVYERKNNCSPNLKTGPIYTISPTQTCQAKKIRICTAAELKRMCPPKLCDCKPAGEGSFKGFAKLLGLGLKGALAGALIYGTYQMGIWGDSDNSEDVFKDICEIATPIFCSNFKPQPLNTNNAGELCEVQEELTKCPKRPPDECCSKPPSISNGMNCLRDTWNRGIICVFDTVANAPERITCTYGQLAAKLNLSEQYRIPRCEISKDQNEEKECPEPK